MKKIHSILLLFITVCIFSQVQVDGYYRKNGTYVRPHVRTSPNSTVTDNYSYKGNYNPNLEYNAPLPRTIYSNKNSSSSNSDGQWVNGYYRSDGTYVQGYNRQKRNLYSNNASKINSVNASVSSNYSRVYINTTKVNFRFSPEVSNNIIGELDQADEINRISNSGYWDKVKVKGYNYDTDSVVYFEGYINSRYLSDYSVTSEITSQNDITTSKSNLYKIVVSQAHFHTSPDILTKKKAYLISGEIITGIAESKYFVYTEYTNTSTGLKTIGWILKDDLKRY